MHFIDIGMKKEMRTILCSCKPFPSTGTSCRVRVEIAALQKPTKKTTKIPQRRLLIPKFPMLHA